MEVDFPEQLGLGRVRRTLNELGGFIAVVTIVRRLCLSIIEFGRRLNILCVLSASKPSVIRASTDLGKARSLQDETSINYTSTNSEFATFKKLDSLSFLENISGSYGCRWRN